jgi:hypothetical protein
MEHWQTTYLGIRQIPRGLTAFELATFFTFSAKERALIVGRRGDLDSRWRSTSSSCE